MGEVSRENKSNSTHETLRVPHVMAAIRQVARNRGWMDRNDLLRELARQLGHQRLSSNIKHTLKGHIRAALRRGILQAEGTQLTLLTPTLAEYTTEFLRETLCPVMRRGTTYTRDEPMTAVLHHLGFRRLTPNARTTLKSTLNSAIRQRLIAYDGDLIWRTE